MARFYVTTTNSRGREVGTPGVSRGQSTHARGWNVGVAIEARVDDEGFDVLHVYSTGGSNYPSADKLIAIVREPKVPGDEPTITPA